MSKETCPKCKGKGITIDDNAAEVIQKNVCSLCGGVGTITQNELPPKPKTCQWKKDGSKGWWDTTCEQRPWFENHPCMFSLSSHYRYPKCPFCGGAIKEIE